MLKTRIASVYGTVKRLYCLWAVLCLFQLSACTQAVPTLTSLSSEVDGIQLTSSKPRFYSKTGGLQINGACDARVTSLQARVMDENKTPLTEFVPLAQLLEAGATNNIDCTGRAVTFSFLKDKLLIDDSSLADGDSIVRFIQVKGETDFGATPEAVVLAKYVKDLTAPVVEVDEVATSEYINLAHANAYVIKGTCEGDLPVEIKYGENAPTVKNAFCVAGRFEATLDVSAEDDGDVVFHMTQLDEAGNISEDPEYFAEKDVVPPDFKIVSISPTGVNFANQNAITMTMRCEVGLKIKVIKPDIFLATNKTLECLPQNSDDQAGDTITYSRVLSAAEAADSSAPVAIEFQVTDEAGNSAKEISQFDWKDTKAGSITLLIGAAATKQFQRFYGTCTPGEGRVKVELSQGAITSTREATCVGTGTAGTYDLPAEDLTSLAFAQTPVINVKAWQEDDPAHNKSAMKTTTFIWDTVAPEVNITSYPTRVGKTLGQNLITVAGTCDYPSTLAMNLPAPGLLDMAPGSCQTNGTWTAKIDLRNYGDVVTTFNLSITATDAAMNTKLAQKSIALDYVPPVVSIVSVGIAGVDLKRYANSANYTNVPLRVSCEGTSAVTLELVQGGTSFAIATPSCAAGFVDTQFTFAGRTEGQYSVRASQTDDFSNVGTSAPAPITFDKTPPPQPTALTSLQNSSTSAPNTTPNFAVVSDVDPGGAIASGIESYAFEVSDANGATGVLKATTRTSPSGPFNLGFTVDFDKAYKLTVTVKDFAGNMSSPFSDTWDYCPYKVVSFPLPGEAPNAGDRYTKSIKIPRACTQGNVAVIAMGEAGRGSSGAYDTTNAEGAGGLSAALFKGSALAGQQLDVAIDGAGLGGGVPNGATGTSTNKNSGGRYAWVETSSSASLLRVVAGGGGGIAGSALTSGSQYPNTPGLGGDPGAGAGRCETTGENYRATCGKNANADGIGTAGAAPAPALNQCNILMGTQRHGVDAFSASADRGFGGRATNNIPDSESGGGGGGFGGGGAGLNGYTSQCYGRSGGGGGSDVSGTALFTARESAVSKIAGINPGKPSVKIVMGLPADPCPFNYIYVPGGAYSTNPHTGRGDAGFCIAKAEMQLVTGGSSPAVGTIPSSSVKFSEAISRCQVGGISGPNQLATNDQWQVVSLIAHWNGKNWRRGKAGYDSNGDNNMSFGAGATSSVFAVPATDSEGCAGTGINCGTNWNEKRRIHTLGPNATIWDLHDNVSEWVRAAFNTTITNYGDVAVMSINPSATTMYPTATTSPYSPTRYYLGPSYGYHHITSNTISGFGLGKLFMNYSGTDNGLLRGGSYASNDVTEFGVFTANFSFTKETTTAKAGFRCVYELPAPGF